MLSIIIANYNEPNLDKVVNECQDLFPKARIIIGHDRHGVGKGYALLVGLELDKRFIPVFEEDIVVFIDGDGDISPRMIKRLLPFLDTYDIVVGRKSKAGMPLSRSILTTLSRIYIKFMFDQDVDTQTGLKAFKSNKIPEWETKGFTFDIEILCKAKRRGCSILEVPVVANVSDRKTLRQVWLALKESLRIWLALLSQ